jgi:hypothetical protein
MMLIGTSLGGCLQSIMKNEVSLQDVLVIITRTGAENYEQMVEIIKTYHSDGNPYATISKNYEISQYPLEDILEIVYALWHTGRIHQPRIFMQHGQFVHPELNANELWLEVVPSPTTDNVAVIDAYKKYRMLSELTK